jgi:serine/threonine protein kinase
MADRVGEQLGNYQVLRLLGSGAFAEVYLAEHRYLEVLAAIKVLHVRMEPNTHEQFRREARTIAHLQHPHIIRVHDFGLQDQMPFLAMEYMPNGMLRTRHPKGTRLPLEQIVQYVKQIASALDYAHQRRVIHRDVKPENMLLSANDEVVLSDFGIAMVQHSLDSLSTQSQAGTPIYMAPEQIQRKPCAASDQYAVGVLIYEWLCGEPPFVGSLFEVLSQHLHELPPSLCTRVPSLPQAVEDAVFCALAKEPSQRFATLEAFVNALQQAALEEASIHGGKVQIAPTHSLRYIGRRQQGPLVGREQQLEVLRQLLSETEQQTHTPPGDHQTTPLLSYDEPTRAPCIMLLGEAGMGKTRLAEELSPEAQKRGWAVIWDRAHPQEHTIPLQLWIEVVRKALAEGHALPFEMRQHPQFYQPLVTLLPELVDLLPQDALSSAVPQEQIQLRIRESILALFTTVSQRMPLLIVLDDLHWADLSSCELLGYLMRRLSDHRLLVVATCRESELPPRHPLRILLADLQRERAVTTLHIPRLNDARSNRPIT